MTTPEDEARRDRDGQEEAERDISALEAEGDPFVKAVEATRMPMLVTDPTIAGNSIIYVNDAFLDLFGYARDEVLGQSYFFLAGEQTDPDIRSCVEAAMSARREITQEVLFYGKDRREMWVSLFVSPLVEDDRVVRHFASLMDITPRVRLERSLREANETLDRRVATRTRRLKQLNARLEEEVERRRRTEVVLRDALAQGENDVRSRDFMIREVNHRSKNALQLAVSLLTIQAARCAEPAVRETLETVAERLHGISDVYALLAYDAEAPQVVDVPVYLNRLCHGMVESLAPSLEQIRVEVDAYDEMRWAPDTVVPVGLIVGEALTNALKHAFPQGREGRIRVELDKCEAGAIRLLVEDDGVGASLERRTDALGLSLIERFAGQLGGRFRLERGGGGRGTALVVTFPDPALLPTADAQAG